MVTYLCLLCCEGQIHISTGTNTILSTHYYFAYGTSHLMCPIPDSCESPSHISAVSTDAEFIEGADGISEPDGEAPAGCPTLCRLVCSGTVPGGGEPGAQEGGLSSQLHRLHQHHV